MNKKDREKGLILPWKVSKDLAYLCGIFAGDGSIAYREKKKDYLIECGGDPKEEVSFYHKVVGPLFEKVFGFVPEMKLLGNKTTYGFRIYSKSLYLYLTEKIGLPSGKKYGKLCIPNLFKKNRSYLLAFIKGVFDTDGCISFKKRGKSYPNYPVVSLGSKSARLIREVSGCLKEIDLKFYEVYDYKKLDHRVPCGFTIISRIEISGRKNLSIWLKSIGFSNPKHKEKIELYM